MEQSGGPHSPSPPAESNRPAGATPGEVKHLSTRRSRNQIRDSASSGERKRKSPNQGACPLGLRDRDTARRMERGTVWKDRPKRVMAPYPNPMPGLAGSQVGRNT